MTVYHPQRVEISKNRSRILRLSRWQKVNAKVVDLAASYMDANGSKFIVVSTLSGQGTDNTPKSALEWILAPKATSRLQFSCLPFPTGER